MSDFRSHIAVIDYGMGNLHSVAKALEHVCPGAKVSITADPNVVEDADRVVFPGVGAIRDCMGEINRLNVGDVVNQAMKTKPVLAICIGMQALMQRSEENGGVDCLGLLPGQVRFFGDDLVDPQGAKLKVPHMGWNYVRPVKDNILIQTEENTRFYFVHSYYVVCINQNDVLTTTNYKECNFVSGFKKDNIVGVQFHPEKSHKFGFEFFKAFLKIEKT